MSDLKIRRLNSILHICNRGHNFSLYCSWNFATVQYYVAFFANVEDLWMSGTGCEVSPCKLLIRNGARACPPRVDCCNVLNFTTMVNTWFPRLMMEIFECPMLWCVFCWSFRCSPAPGCDIYRLWTSSQQFLRFSLLFFEAIGHAAKRTCIKLLTIGTTSTPPTFDRSAAKKRTLAVLTSLACWLIFPSQKLNNDGFYKPLVVRVSLKQVVSWFDPEWRAPQCWLGGIVPQSPAEVVSYFVVRCEHFPLYNCQFFKFNECPKDTYGNIGCCGDVDVSIFVWGRKKPWPHYSFVWHGFVCWEMLKKRQFMQFETKD